MTRSVIKVTRVGREHPVCRPSAWRDLPRWPRSFLESACCNQTPEAVVATYKGELVGFVRVAPAVWRHGQLTAGGTWVSKPFRRDHLALSMWSHVLRAYRWPIIKEVDVVCLNRASEKMMRKVSSLFPKIIFQVSTRRA